MDLLFPVSELFVLAIFLVGLMALFLELAIKDAAGLRTLLADPETFARMVPSRHAALRSGYRRVEPGQFAVRHTAMC